MCIYFVLYSFNRIFATLIQMKDELCLTHSSMKKSVN